MSRTDKDIPRNIAYKNITGKNLKESQSHVITLDDLDDLIQKEYVTFSALALSTRDFGTTYSRNLCLNRGPWKTNREYIEKYVITSPQCYIMEYSFIKDEPLSFPFCMLLEEYKEHLGDSMFPVIDDQRVVEIDKMSSSWEKKGQGFVKCSKNIFSENEYIIKSVAIEDPHVINIRSEYTHIGHISGQDQNTLKKHGMYRPDSDYSSHDVYGSIRASERDMLKDIVKDVNSGNDIDDVDDYSDSRYDLEYHIGKNYWNR